jgi:hypothetical protein
MVKITSEELLRLIEEAYLELSASYGWRPINCYHYSFKHGVCYGAPIFLGGKEVWRKEGNPYNGIERPIGMHVVLGVDHRIHIMELKVHGM